MSSLYCIPQTVSTPTEPFSSPSKHLLNSPQLVPSSSTTDLLHVHSLVSPATTLEAMTNNTPDDIATQDVAPPATPMTSKRNQSQARLARNKQMKSLRNYRQSLLETEERRVVAIESLVEQLAESNRIQRERNDLIKKNNNLD